MYFVYFLESERNGKRYVGLTSKDPQIRLLEHNQGSDDWTGENGPFALKYYEEYECERDAAKRETFYKSGFGRKIRDAIIEAVSAKERGKSMKRPSGRFSFDEP